MMERSHNQRGFTLIEIAIVLLIVGLLTRTLIEPISMARQHKKYSLTQSELQQVKDSVHAHLIAHGYLPCPILNADVNQVSNSEEGGECEIRQGYVPAVVLGLSGAINSHGALLDVWNRPYVYTVSLSNHTSKGNTRFPDWTTPGEASNVGLRHLSAELVLCVEPSRVACPKRQVRANNLAFVVLSLGQDDSTTGAQSENQDGDETFVINPLSIRTDSPFDDQIVWSSTQDILYWMLRAAWLP